MAYQQEVHRHQESFPLVVAIILNWNGRTIVYNGRSILEQCLESLKTSTYPSLKLILVDASSQDDSVEFVRTKYPDIKILIVRNIGFAYANNKAMEYALRTFPELSYILLLNNDLIFLEKGWLEHLVSAAAVAKVGIVGCKLLFPDGSIQHSGGQFDRFGRICPPKDHPITGYTDYVTGAVFLVKCNVLEKIGMLDESYCPFYYEETDFCMRARAHGYLTFFVSDTNIVHLEGHTFRAKNVRPPWDNKTLYLAAHRNKYIFLLRWYRSSLILHFALKAKSYVQDLLSSEGLGEKKLYHGLSAVSVAWMELRALVLALSRYRQELVPPFRTTSPEGS